VHLRVGADITERKRAEEASEGTERLQNILDTSRSVSFQAGQIAFANRPSPVPSASQERDGAAFVDQAERQAMVERVIREGSVKL
jgi:PAS domain-containing protein